MIYVRRSLIVVLLVAQAAVVSAADNSAIARVVAGVIAAKARVTEGESLVGKATATNGGIGRQEMAAFGPGWSGNAHLFWAPTVPNAQLRFILDVPADGKFVLVIYHTQAPDFGNVSVTVDRNTVGTFSGYGAGVSLSKATFPVVTLTKGSHNIVLGVFAKEKKSANYFVGIDKLELTAVEALTAGGVSGATGVLRAASALNMRKALQSGSVPDPLFVTVMHTLERGLSGQQGGRSPFDDAFNDVSAGGQLNTSLAQQLVSEFRSATNGRTFASVPGSMGALRTDAPFTVGGFRGEFSQVGRSTGGTAKGSLMTGGLQAVGALVSMEGISDPQIITIYPEAPMGYKRGQVLDVNGRNLVLKGWNTSVSIISDPPTGWFNSPLVQNLKGEELVIPNSQLVGLSASGFQWKIPSDLGIGKYILAVTLTKIQKSLPGQKPESKYDIAYLYVEKTPPGQPIVQSVESAKVGKLWIIAVQRLGDEGDAHSILMKPLDGQTLWYSWNASGEKVSVLKAGKVLDAAHIGSTIPANFPPGRYLMAVDSKSYGHSPWQEVFVNPIRASVHLSTISCINEWPPKAKDDQIVTICVTTTGRNVQVNVLDPIGPFGDGKTISYVNPAAAVFPKGGGMGGLYGDLRVGLCIARWPKGVQTFAQRGLQPIADLACQMASKNDSIETGGLAWSVLDSVSKLVVWAGGDVLLSQNYVPKHSIKDLTSAPTKWSGKLAAQPGTGPCLYEIAYTVVREN